MKCERLRRFAQHVNEQLDYDDEHEGEEDFLENNNAMDPVEEAVIQDEMFEHRHYPEADLENLLDGMDLEVIVDSDGEEEDEIPPLEDMPREIEFVFEDAPLPDPILQGVV